MLNDKASYATIPVSDLQQAKHFYGETLGLLAAGAPRRD